MPKKQKLPTPLEKRGEVGGICKWPSAGTVAGGLAEMRVSQWFRGVRPHSFRPHSFYPTLSRRKTDLKWSISPYFPKCQNSGII